MIGEEIADDPTTKRIKQTISVPFLWEEKPGTPKRDWKRPNPIMQLPIKLIASVPFQWEEKPGTPLCGPVLNPLQDSKIVHSFVQDSQQRNGMNPFHDSDTEVEEDEMLESELDTPFSPSSPELTIVHSSVNYLCHKSNPFCDSDGEVEDSGYIRAPSSRAWETDSVTSSYAMGTTTTLVGSSFLEYMFPLLTPKSSFENGVSRPPPNTSTKGFDLQTVTNAVGRKALTLGELIMMSRRRSYLKKAVHMHDHNLSTEFMKRTAFGCCIGVEGLQKWRRQLQLN